MRNAGIFVLAALAEIGGCYAFWLWQKRDRSPVLALGGVVALLVFAWLLTRVDVNFAGRAYAAYGGIYIGIALAWLWMVEGATPDRWDFIGMALCVVGALVIILGPRTGERSARTAGNVLVATNA